jgi:hypothetical protein
MARAETNWERLVRAALRRDRGRTGAYGYPMTGIAGAVPTSLGNNVHIEEILRAADEIQDEDPNIARICKSFFLVSVVFGWKVKFCCLLSSRIWHVPVSRDKKKKRVLWNIRLLSSQ